MARWHGTVPSGEKKNKIQNEMIRVICLDFSKY
jgi:hypothetical protein